MKSYKTTRMLVALAALTVLVGCSTIKPYDKLSIIATKDVNPDGNNRPSPIQFKVLQLTARTTIDNMDFDSLFYHAEKILSDELLSEDTYMVLPNETIESKMLILPDAHYIAIVAAYRDIDESRWKHVYEVSPHGHYKHAFTLGDSQIIVGDEIIE